MHSTLPRNNSRSLPWKRRNVATTLWRMYIPLARSRLLQLGSSSTSTTTSSSPLSPILIVFASHQTVLEQPLAMSPSTSLNTTHIPYNFIKHTKPNQQRRPHLPPRGPHLPHPLPERADLAPFGICGAVPRPPDAGVHPLPTSATDDGG